MAEARAFNDFPPAEEAVWRRLVEQALDGRPLETIVSFSFEGLDIRPLYEAASSSTPRALRQAGGPWKIAQRIDHPDPATAAAMARADLDGGADALVLTIAGAPAARGFGTHIHTAVDLDATLRDIDLDRVEIRVDAGTHSLDIARHAGALADDRRLTSAALDVDFGHDPIGAFARSGTLPATPEAIGRDSAATLRMLHDKGFRGHLFLADGRPYHEAGAGESQELGCVVSTAVAYLRFLETAGLALDEARDEIAFLLAADADQYLSIAKFRALRRLWARVESACGLTPKPIRLHAETSFRMMTRYDPRMNVLRATIAAFAASVGGADIVTVLPYTLVHGLPDAAARRLARNTSLVLIHEARLAEVADPAAGSGAFEALTEALCTRAWALFQHFEQAGGMIASLVAGLPRALVAETAAARHAALGNRGFGLVGTSLFPGLAETAPHVLDVDRVEPEAPSGIAAATCPVLPAHRDAEPFEQLRAVSDAMLAKTGARPRVFLASLAPGASSVAAEAFARDLFAVAGIEAVRHVGGTSPGAVAAGFTRSGCQITCLSMASPADDVAARVEALAAAGATGLTLLCLSPDYVPDVRLSEKVELVRDGCDALAVLGKALSRATKTAPAG